MNMNQKGFASIIIIIGVVILVSIAGYFIVNQQRSSSQQNQATCIPEGGLNYENVYSETPIDQRLKCCHGLVPQENSGIADAPAVCIKPVPKNETTDWQIYKNVTCGYSIKYPKDWIASSRDYHLVLLLPKSDEQMLTAMDYRADININCDSLHAKSLGELVTNLQNKKETTFSKVKAYEGTMLGIPTGVIQITAFSNNNHLYRIDYGASDTVTKILSTFKFIQ